RPSRVHHRDAVGTAAGVEPAYLLAHRVLAGGRQRGIHAVPGAWHRPPAGPRPQRRRGARRAGHHDLDRAARQGSHHVVRRPVRSWVWLWRHLLRPGRLVLRRSSRVVLHSSTCAGCCMKKIEEGALLWTPGPARLARSHLTRYLAWLAERGRHFEDYEALWRW